MIRLTTPAPHHRPRCGAPMVRVRAPGGRYVGEQCAGCVAYNCGRVTWTCSWPARYDSRDWRRLLRWRAGRGML